MATNFPEFHGVGVGGRFSFTLLFWPGRSGGWLRAIDNKANSARLAGVGAELGKMDLLPIANETIWRAIYFRFIFL